MTRNVHTNDIPCPTCSENIEIEYDMSTLYSILGGCPHAMDWTEGKMGKEEKYKYDHQVWQWIEDHWAWREEEARAEKYE